MTFKAVDRVAPDKDGLPACSSIAFLMAGFLPEKQMAKMTYAEQLRHPNWQRRRLEILNFSNFSCGNCGDSESTLNVHHKYYRKGRMAWEYEDHELIALCERCHKDEHWEKELLEQILVELGTYQSVGVLAGYATRSGYLGPKLSAEIYRDHKLEFVVGYAGAHIERLPKTLDKAIAAVRKDMSGYPDWDEILKAEKT